MAKKDKSQEYVPPCLCNLSEIQKRNREKFIWLCENFYLGKSDGDWENPKNDTSLFIAISDGYLGGIDVGEIKGDESIHLIYPQTKAIDCSNFREVLDGTLKLRNILEERKIGYQENINRVEYISQIVKETEKAVSDLTAKLL